MDFEELIALLQGGEAPETVYDDLRTLYGGVTGRAEGADAKVGELNAMVEGMQREIAALKSQNYDLLMSSAGAAPADVEPEDEAESEGEPEDYDDLFTDGEEGNN